VRPSGEGDIVLGIGGDKHRIGPAAFLGEIDRRTFIKLGGMSAAALIAGLGPYSERAMARVGFSDYPFKLGVASGDPAPDGVVLWTRLAPEPLAADGHGGVPGKIIPVRDPPDRQTRDPRRTLTGARQERWFKEGLTGSRATWNVLAQQVFFSELDFQSGPGELFNMDAWDGYEAQRNRLVNFLANRNVPNPVVLTGDVHTNWANDIKKNFDDPDSETVGTEYVGTSITSDGNGSGATTYGSPIVDANPHIEFFNDQRGYVRCTLTPGEWRSDYRVVPYVNRKGAPVLTAASFVTEAGNPGAQKDSGVGATGRTAPAAAIERARMEAER
jgi:phosphodiesterase/alkaline phosphatase D-like protein